MPWTAADAKGHTRKANTDAKRRRWAATANSVLDECLKKGGSQETCEARAIRIANAGVVREEARMGKGASLTQTGVHIHESVAIMGSDLKVDKDAGVIRGLRVINRKRRTGNRTYSNQALTDIAEKLDGKKAYANHSSRGGTRTVQELLGVWTNARVHLQEGYVSGDLKVIPRERWLLETAEKVPEALAMSIDARALLTKRDGKETVNRILVLESVDAVTEGGTTHGLFESSKGGDNDMTIESLTELKTECPSLIEEYKAELLEEFKAGNEQEAQVIRLTAELKSAKETTDKTAKRLDELETEKKAMEHRETVEKALAEAKLPDFAVSEEWRKTLESFDAEELKTAIQDRKQLIEKASGSKRSAVSSERKAGGEDMQPKDLREALTG